MNGLDNSRLQTYQNQIVYQQM